ncbi:MAG: 3-methyl-2-oxobutanoate hydroxymethyltransferase [Pyrodictiaceae archaeon]
MGRITVREIISMKKKGEPIAMVTAYDYPTAKIVDEAGVDMILVGDSVGMVVYGYPSTHQVTMDIMLKHTEAVARAAKRALIVADMPFGSYETSSEEAVKNAIRLVRVGAGAVKLEGGTEYADRVRAIVNAGIPVMGHIGLTPQRYLRLGGYRKRGKTRSELESLIEDAVSLEEAGAFAIVIEYTAEEAAREITRRIEIPTICIGSGRYCDGQVLVLHDILGLSEHIPPFAKKYANLSEIILDAVRRYVEDVKTRRFPGEEHVFHMKE